MGGTPPTIRAVRPPADGTTTAASRYGGWHRRPLIGVPLPPRPPAPQPDVSDNRHGPSIPCPLHRPSPDTTPSRTPPRRPSSDAPSPASVPHAAQHRTSQPHQRHSLRCPAPRLLAGIGLPDQTMPAANRVNTSPQRPLPQALTRHTRAACLMGRAMRCPCPASPLASSSRAAAGQRRGLAKTRRQTRPRSTLNRFSKSS